MPIVTIPKVLREKLGEDGADALVQLINAATDRAEENVIKLVEEKFERRLSEEVNRLEQRIAEEAVRLDQRITQEVAKLDQRITEEMAKLEVHITQVEPRLIRWMFIFGCSSFGWVRSEPFPASCLHSFGKGRPQ